MNTQQTFLVTGGAGYIGSHTVVQLIEAGNKVVILDNLSNSKREVINRLERITGVMPELIIGDIRDRALLRTAFAKHSINAVLHFAGLKAVGDSETEPLHYFDNNVSGSITLFEEMARANIKTLVFSSSATVYGDPGYPEYTEDTPTNPINVYGRTKLMVEEVLRELKRTDSTWKITILRYFNPVGAHESGLIGEDPYGKPNNLMPVVAQVAVGKRPVLDIFGNDYPTPDGTGERDFIHVVDLAAGHIAALNALNNSNELITLNLGTGRPHTVLELIHAFESASGQKIQYRFAARRAGDSASSYTASNLAFRLLDWSPSKSLAAMCADTWRWQKNNPIGYMAEPSNRDGSCA